MQLENKVALVTGSARRVGKVIALELARQGVHLVVTHGHSADAAAKTVSEIEALGVKAIAVQADLTSEADIDNLFSAIKSYHGRLDVVVNSASAWVNHDLLTMSGDDWDMVMGVNLKAPFLISQRAIRMMLDQDEGGAIINISDTSAITPYRNKPDHSVSKAALVTLTEVMAKEFARYNIRINAIMPGPIMIPTNGNEARWRQLGEVLPRGQTGSAKDVAEAVVALASIEFIHGAVLKVDGGETLLGLGDVLNATEKS